MSEIEIKNNMGIVKMKLHDDGSITYFTEDGKELSAKEFYLLTKAKSKEN